MCDPDSLKELIEGLNSMSSFSILTHVSPDGDTLGAGLAMYIMLTSMGKKAEVVCEEPVPHIYCYLY